MVNILTFKPRAARETGPGRGPAEIIIFPGIRYERLESTDMAADAPEPRLKANMRDLPHLRRG